MEDNELKDIREKLSPHICDRIDRFALNRRSVPFLEEERYMDVCMNYVIEMIRKEKNREFTIEYAKYFNEMWERYGSIGFLVLDGEE